MEESPADSGAISQPVAREAYGAVIRNPAGGYTIAHTSAGRQYLIDALRNANENIGLPEFLKDGFDSRKDR